MDISNFRKNFSLKKYNTLRVDSIAQYFIEVRTKEEIIEVLRFAKKNKLSTNIIGGGSNIGFTSKHIKGIIIKNSYIQKKEIEKNDKFSIYQVSSGYPTTKLANEMVDEGYEGLEYHMGLPGTIGGAVYMNSKWTNPLSYIGDLVVNAYLLDSDLKIKKVNRNYFKFAYDYSVLQDTKEILLDIDLKFWKKNPAHIKKISRQCFNFRKSTQPFGLATSGCFFRNITDKEKNAHSLPTNSAGYLIDKSGLKGTKVGDFVVSDKHANFVINTGNGTPEDLKKIVKIIKDRVYNKFKINLREEVEFIN
jgi:UDP-N-acetylenolpyruvoylglucosamine reductase